jgi:hypothetical protein
MRVATAIGFILAAITFAGCANRLRTTVAPEFASTVTQVDTVGVGGPGASHAAQAFIELGYKPVDLGSASADVIETAKTKGVRFVAIADATDTSEAVWNGFFTFGMRVSDSVTGSVVWSGSATYGGGGGINQQSATKRAYIALVRDFAKCFPPQAGLQSEPEPVIAGD